MLYRGGPVSITLAGGHASEFLQADLGEGALHGLPPEVDHHPLGQLPQLVTDECVGVDEVRLARRELVRVEVAALQPGEAVLAWGALPIKTSSQLGFSTYHE